MRTQIRFSLDTDKDKDIISYLDTLSSHSRIKLFRDLVRQHIVGDKETVIDKLNKIMSKLDKITRDGSVSIPSAWLPDDNMKIPESVTTTNAVSDKYIDYDTGELLDALDNLGK